MRIYLTKTSYTFLFFVLLLPTTYSQTNLEKQVWKQCLAVYQDNLNILGNKDILFAEREQLQVPKFEAQFTSTEVEVFNDLEPDSDNKLLTVEEYILEILTKYKRKSKVPSIAIQLDKTSLTLQNIRRTTAEATIKKHINGRTHHLTFYLTFEQPSNNVFINFKIRGITGDWWDNLETQWKKAFNHAVLNRWEIVSRPSELELKRILNTQILSVDGQELTNLNGLENLTNLTYLFCCSNQLRTLSGIENLTNLTYLSCHNNQLITLSGLENLTNLTYLSCSSNQLRTLSGLENLTSLTALDCFDNQLITLSGIEKLINLTELYCSSNQLRALSGIENLTNLTELYCSSNQLTSLSGIEKLNNLKELYCSSNQLRALSGIEKLNNLKELYCFDNKLITLRGLTQQHQKNLEKFYVFPNSNILSSEIEVIKGYGIECLTKKKGW